MELYLLGITVAVLVLFEELIEIVNDPILSAPSATRINSPFSNEIHFRSKDFWLLVFTFLMTNPFLSFIPNYCKRIEMGLTICEPCNLFLALSLALYFKFLGFVLKRYPQHGHHSPSHLMNISQI